MDAVVRTDGDDGILHTVEKGLQLALAGLQRREAISRWLAVSSREAAHLADFVCRPFIQACGKISGGDSPSKLLDPLQARSGRVRGHGGEYKSDNKTNQKTWPYFVREHTESRVWQPRSQ